MTAAADKATTAAEAEPGRDKNRSTPAEHLRHLLNIGWMPYSPLIKKYVARNGLQEELRRLLT
jgi:hypothetical protein